MDFNASTIGHINIFFLSNLWATLKRGEREFERTLSTWFFHGPYFAVGSFFNFWWFVKTAEIKLMKRDTCWNFLLSL